MSTPAEDPQPQYPPPHVWPVNSQAEQTVKKASIGTVTVIVVLVGIFCVLPMVACLGVGTLAQLGGH